MSEDKKNIVYRCPECFARDVDVNLRKDPGTEEYYCTKCCFSGTESDILAHYGNFQQRKYRGLTYFSKLLRD